MRLALEHPTWHDDVLPVDFPAHEGFYCNPVFFPLLDMFLMEEGRLRVPSWPGGRFAVALTYDLDSFDLRVEAFRKLLRGIVRRDVRCAASGARWLLRTTGSTDFHEYMKILSEEGVQGTFFVPSCSRINMDPRDPCFFLTDRMQGGRIGEVLNQTREAGHEIGLHLSIDASLQRDSVDRVLEEKDGLAAWVGNVQSVRAHWLMFDIHASMQAFREAGLICDSSYGYNRMPGFRAGSSFPFFREGVLEVPLILQDGAFFAGLGAGALGLSLDKGIELAKAIMDRVAAVGGVVTILCHPTSDRSQGEKRRKWLKALIRHAREREGVFMRMQDIVEFWNEAGKDVEAAMREIDRVRFAQWLRSGKWLGQWLDV